MRDVVCAHMYTAVIASMQVVRRDLFSAGRGVETKPDGTIVTPTDKLSESAGKAILRRIPNVVIHGEETGAEGDGDLLIYLDPLDGSMPFSVGAPTSTVIVAAIEKVTGKIVYCLVGEPQSGRIWRAEVGGICEVTIPAIFIPPGAGKQDDYSWRQTKVWPGMLKKKNGRIFLDSYPDFTKNGRQIFSRSQLNTLHANVHDRVGGLLLLGSNAIHHALVANGGNGAIGAVTTAIGGPWDVCAVLLVLSAGGYARAFSKKSTLWGRNLIERNPLEVASYDILVSGNSEETVNALVGCLENC